jgi:hypothetical protein
MTNQEEESQMIKVRPEEDEEEESVDNEASL